METSHRGQTSDIRSDCHPGSQEASKHGAQVIANTSSARSHHSKETSHKSYESHRDLATPWRSHQAGSVYLSNSNCGSPKRPGKHSDVQQVTSRLSTSQACKLVETVQIANVEIFCRPGATNPSIQVLPPHRYPPTTSVGPASTTATPDGIRASDHGRRGADQPRTRPLRLPNLRHPQEICRAQIDLRPTSTEQVPTAPQVQAAIRQEDHRTTSSRRLHGLDRSAVRLLSDAHSSRGSGPASVPAGQSILQVQSPPIWPVNRSQYVPIPIQPSDTLTEDERRSILGISRRCTHRSQITREGSIGTSSPRSDAQRTGLHSSPREGSMGTYATTGVPRYDDRYDLAVHRAAKRKSAEDDRPIETSQEKYSAWSKRDHERSGIDPGLDLSGSDSYPRDSSRSTPPQSRVQQKIPRMEKEHQTIASVHSSHRQSVRFASETETKTIPSDGSSSVGSQHRRIDRGIWGGDLEARESSGASEQRRTMVKGNVGPSHQPPGGSRYGQGATSSWASASRIPSQATSRFHCGDRLSAPRASRIGGASQRHLSDPTAAGQVRPHRGLDSICGVQGEQGRRAIQSIRSRPGRLQGETVCVGFDLPEIPSAAGSVCEPSQPQAEAFLGTFFPQMGSRRRPGLHVSPRDIMERAPLGQSTVFPDTTSVTAPNHIHQPDRHGASSAPLADYTMGATCPGPPSFGHPPIQDRRVSVRGRNAVQQPPSTTATMASVHTARPPKLDSVQALFDQIAVSKKRHLVRVEGHFDHVMRQFVQLPSDVALGFLDERVDELWKDRLLANSRAAVASRLWPVRVLAYLQGEAFEATLADARTPARAVALASAARRLPEPILAAVATARCDKGLPKVSPVDLAVMKAATRNERLARAAEDMTPECRVPVRPAVLSFLKWEQLRWNWQGIAVVMVMIGASTGIRAADVAKLCWKQVEHHPDLLILDTYKGGRLGEPLYTPLERVSVGHWGPREVLQRWKAILKAEGVPTSPSDLILPHWQHWQVDGTMKKLRNERQNILFGTVMEWLHQDETCKDSPLIPRGQGLSLHSCRAGMAVALLEAGYQLEIVMKWLGWASKHAASRYIGLATRQWTPDHNLSVTDKVMRVGDEQVDRLAGSIEIPSSYRFIFKPQMRLEVNSQVANNF